QLIQNEIQELDREKNLPAFDQTNQINASDFTLDIAENAKAHLKELQQYYSKNFKLYRKKKDQLIRGIAKEKGKDFLYNQKLKHHNKSLEVLVLNSTSKEVYRETESGIMQKIAPVYKAPDFKSGRAHFLSSEKIVGSKTMNTFTFDLLIIWLMCFILYLSLYFDWLRKLIYIFGKIKLK
ncbi:MAG: hypothetical protein PF541_11430, partial [Prolixibacteraceae bacterium]|nr:hypothetical protein [Prolixibacteraceae bacterium]